MCIPNTEDILLPIYVSFTNHSYKRYIIIIKVLFNLLRFTKIENYMSIEI